jgi:hypothetical protein
LNMLWKWKLVLLLWKTVWIFLKKSEIELPDPTTPILVIYPKEIKSVCQSNIWTSMFITALSTITKTRNQRNYSTTDEWIKENVVHINPGILLSHKKNEVLLFMTIENWRSFNIMKQAKLRMTSTICGI